MEKLIELLNEFEKKAVVHRYERYGQDVLLCRYIKDNFEYYTDEAATIAISKYYGFIEWLVQNNKIDKRKIDTRLVRYVESHYDEEGYWVENSYEDYSDTNTLIMLLSISRTPIEDLISYLR